MNAAKPKQTNDSGTDEEMRDDAIIGKAMFWSAAIFFPILLIGVVIAVVLNQKPVETVEDKSKESVISMLRDTQSIEIPRIHWVDATSQAGLNFVHCNGVSDSKLLPETMGGGVTCLDFDQDGDTDIFFTNSCYWDPKENAEKRPTCVLYSNQGDGTFVDVTQSMNLNITGFGMGAAVGDFDGDGWPDLFLSNLGPNRMLKNNQGKSFTDVTVETGLAGPDSMWSTSCGWFDANNDGHLDLMVCNYLNWTKEEDISLESTLNGQAKAYARPDSFGGTSPLLYINDGEGKFSEVSQEAGLRIKNNFTDVPVAKSLGLAFCDIDNDNFMDMFVANDTVQNMFFRNKGDGTFEEIGNRLGVAYDSSGRARGAMGIDVRFIRPDSQLATVIGNFANEPVSFFVRQNIAGVNMLTDEAMATGIGPQTRLELTFGTLLLDYDLDGRLDFLTANGHLETEIAQVQPNQSYRQSPHFFWNTGLKGANSTEFISVPKDKTDQGFSDPMVARGVAYADFDSDGDLDVVIAACGEKVRYLRNDQQAKNHWLQLKLKGPQGNPDGLGALVTVTAGDLVQKQWMSPTRSYLSQVDSQLYYGLGKENKIDSISVLWPGGIEQKLAGLSVDAKHNITYQGSTVPVVAQ